MILESPVGRPPECVPRGVWQGITRRNSHSIATSYNAARRHAARALGAVAAFTQQVNHRPEGIFSNINMLPIA